MCIAMCAGLSLFKRKKLAIICGCMLLVVFWSCTEKLSTPGDVQTFQTKQIKGYILENNQPNTMQSKFQSYLKDQSKVMYTCKGSYIGCFKSLEGIFPLEDFFIIHRPKPSSCYVTNRTYFAALRDGTFMCGVQIARPYVHSDALLPDVDEQDCIEHQAYPIFMKQNSCGKENFADLQPSWKACLSLDDTTTVVVNETFITADACRDLCFKLDFVMFGINKNERCVCTYPTLRVLDYISRKAQTLSCQNNNVETLLSYTNAEDKRCSKKKFLPSKSIPPIALLSFPGSGNSWARHLIELVTGIYSGSIYDNKGMFQKGYLGEYLPWNSGKTVVIKSHKPYKEPDRQYEKVILLVRNPFDALMAEFNRVHGGQTGYANEEKFSSDEWKTFVPYKMKKWSQTCFTYIEDKVPLLLVYYENLVKNPKTEIERMIDWINITIPKFDERLACTLSNTAGLLRRKKRPLHVNPFDKTMTSLINNYVENVRLLVQKHHLNDLPSYERHT